MKKMFVLSLLTGFLFIIAGCSKFSDIKSHGTPLAPSSEYGSSGGDSYESDDSSTYATYLAVGNSQTHSLTSSDVDWVYFYAYSGTSYTIETGPTGGTDVDTVIYLYDSSIYQLTSDDDGGSGNYSQII